MITKRMLDIYLQCRGDSSALAIGILSKIPDKAEIAANWQLLVNLAQTIALLRNGKASRDFAAQLNAEIAAWTDSPETVRRAFEVAEIIHPR